MCHLHDGARDLDMRARGRRGPGPESGVRWSKISPTISCTVLGTTAVFVFTEVRRFAPKVSESVQGAGRGMDESGRCFSFDACTDRDEAECVEPAMRGTVFLIR